MTTREQHFVTFASPGTFVHETSQQPIEAWDTAMAVSMAKTVTERHGAKPFAFQFSTAIVADPIDDGRGGKLDVQPREVKKSGFHFIGGVVLTIEDVKAHNDPNESTLIRNMDGNGIAFVCENRNSYKSVNAFDENDVIVDPETGAILERGNSPERMKVRKAVALAHENRWKQSS